MPKPDVFDYTDDAGNGVAFHSFSDGTLTIGMEYTLAVLLHPENVKALIAWLQDVSADDNS